MDIPRRKNRQHPDKLTAELLFFCFWLTRCGEVELGCLKDMGLKTTDSIHPPATAAMLRSWRSAEPYCE